MESTGIQSLLVMSLLLTTGLCQQQPLVVPNPITANQPFTVTCEANRVPTVTSDVTFIYSLTLSRNISASTAILANYASSGPPGSILNTSTIPAGRNWTISFNGSNGLLSPNKNTMRIVLVVGDTRCDDAGVYLCHVIYYKSGTSEALPADNAVNVTATAGMGPIELSVTPPTDYNTNQYKPGDNITFTCTVQGQSTLKIGWRLYVLEQDKDIPSDAVVTNPTATPIGTGSCAEYAILGTLSLQLGNYNQEETYACVVTDSSNTVLRMETKKNITIASAQPQTGPSKAASPDVGMIVGIVIGCVVLIAIIIIVIFFVLRRKRSKEGGNYKSNSDQADANRNTDLHAPPPVFHSTSKSNKGFKEEKEVSKTPSARHDIPHDDDVVYGNKRGDGKSRDRTPYFDGNYNSGQEPTTEQKYRKGQQAAPRSSHGEPHYASTDISQSGDESADQSDVPLDGRRTKPRATRRSQVPPRGNKPLHYAELDLPHRMDGSESGSDAGRRRAEVPVEYAEIRV